MAVRQIVKNARKNDGIPKTAQQSIPFDRMFPDGICRVGLDYYTKTVQFQDINYQLAQQEDKTEIFEEWCAFLNFFDSSVKFQLSFENMATDVSDFEKSIKISHKMTDSMMSGMSIRKCSFTRWKREIMVLRRLNILLSGYMRSP